MKKLLTCVLALALVLSLSVTAFAAESSINQGSTDKSGSTSINYTVAPAYTVTIPASVTLGNSVTVAASGVKVAKGSQVVVKLTGTSESDNTFEVKTTEGAALTYTVKSDENDTINVNDAVLTVNPDTATDGNGASGSTKLSFELNDTIQYAGTYTGTVTFTVSVETVPAGPQ